MTKGIRRHIRSNVSKIREAMQQDGAMGKRKDTNPHQCLEEEHVLNSGPTHRKRRLGPLRVVKGCPCTCELSIVAAGMWWDAGEPITLPNFDLLSATGRNAAHSYLLIFDPDFVLPAPPRTEWSQHHRSNQKTPTQARLLRRRRKEQLLPLSFIDTSVDEKEPPRHG